MIIRKYLISSTALGLCIGFAAAPGLAQTAAAPAAETAGLQEIIVTARKSSENLQTVPVAVTALGAEALAAKQIFEVTDLARTAPSLTISTGGTGPASIVYLAIRGQAQNSPNSLSDSSVGIYIDGVYVARPIVGNLGFLDMASAEVLRGPQGTLFGRNTTGGALNLTSNQPTDKFEGYLKAGAGKFNQRVFEGVVNVPLSSEVSARVAARYSSHDGYFKNPVTGRAQGSVDGEYVVRGTVKWTPDALPIKFTVTSEYVDYKDSGNATAVVAVNPNILTSPALGAFINSEFKSFVSAAQLPSFTAANSKWTDTFGGPQTGDAQIDNLHNSNNVYSVSGTLEWDLGDANLKSITAYRKSSTEDSLDLHGLRTTSNPYSPFIPNASTAFVSTYHQNQFSQELQLSGTIGKIDWQTGLYYFVERGDEQSRAFILGGVAKARTLSDYRSRSAGAYAQGNYHVTDALRVTAGFRYTWDGRSINRHSTDNWSKADDLEVCTVGPNTGKTAAQAPCNNPESANFKYPAWTFGVDYRVTDGVFVYAKTSGAAMAGGFNTRFVPAPYSASFQPETVRDVEVGFKGDFLDRRLRTNLAIFGAKQNDVQRIVNALVGTSLTQFVSNAGKVNAKGAEFEATALPWTGMELTGSVSYLDAKYKKGSRSEPQKNGQVDNPATTGVDESISIVDRSGEPVTQAPKWTYNIGATQTVPVDFGSVSFHLDYAHTSSRAMDAFTTGNPAQAAAVDIGNRASIIKAYGLLNGRIAVNIDKPNLELAVWGRNLTDQPWFTNVFNQYTGLGTTTQFQGAPRTFGASATFRY